MRETGGRGTCERPGEGGVKETGEGKGGHERNRGEGLGYMYTTNVLVTLTWLSWRGTSPAAAAAAIDAAVAPPLLPVAWGAATAFDPQSSALSWLPLHRVWAGPFPGLLTSRP